MGGRGAGAGINRDGADALNYYVSGEGMWINQYLRGNGDFGDIDESEEQFIRDLDSVTNGKIENSVLYRTVDASAIFGNITEEGYENLRNELLYSTYSNGKGAYSQNIAKSVSDTISKAINKNITEKGFMSTTKQLSIAENNQYNFGSDKPVVMEIVTNGKARGADVMKYANADTRIAEREDPQREVLLKRNTRYRVNNISAKNGNIYVKVSLI